LIVVKKTYFGEADNPTHPVKVVNQVIDNLDIDAIIRNHKGRY